MPAIRAKDTHKLVDLPPPRGRAKVKYVLNKEQTVLRQGCGTSEVRTVKRAALTRLSVDDINVNTNDGGPCTTISLEERAVCGKRVSKRTISIMLNTAERDRLIKMLTRED